MKAADLGTWSGDWAWSLPLIVLNVLIHVLGLQFVNDAVVSVLSGAVARRRFMSMFAEEIIGLILKYEEAFSE